MSAIERSAVLVEHDGTKVVRISEWPAGKDPVVLSPEGLGGGDFAAAVNLLPRKFKDHWLVWCRTHGDADLGVSQSRMVEALVSLPRHQLELWHCALTPAVFRAVRSLGYIDLDDPVLIGAPGRHVSWLISAECGVAHGSSFAAVPWGDGTGRLDSSWIDFGRRASRAGCLCMAEPELSSFIQDADSRVGQRLHLESMIERCYGERWVRFWSLSRLLFGSGRLSALWCLLTRTSLRVLHSNAGRGGDFPDPLPVVSRERDLIGSGSGGGSGRGKGDGGGPRQVKRTVSVVVPTFGREASLRSLFLDLMAQETAVAEVIVVEQRPVGAVPYETEMFAGTSFRCIHRAVHWIGAGRARNLGVSLASGEWILFVDDDVGLGPSFVTEMLDEAEDWAADALCAAVVTPTEEQRVRVANAIEQPYAVHRGLVAEQLHGFRKRVAGEGALSWAWSGLAGCSSLIRRRSILDIDGFDQRLDLGYGEDYELGVRLRRKGAVVLTTNRVALVHLHAPAGGFRALEGMDWDGGEEPKPSPYVLLSRAGLTVEMQRAYQLIYLMRGFTSSAFRWPWQWLGVVRRLRSAHRWKQRFRLRERGGIAENSEDGR